MMNTAMPAISIEIGKVYRRYDGVLRFVESIEDCGGYRKVNGRLYDPSCDPPRQWGPASIGIFWAEEIGFKEGTTGEVALEAVPSVGQKFFRDSYIVFRSKGIE